ncbi:hypothetical protein PIB30_100596, partial [Stylosanthes scabra]|nr:hypothetical protein [Stylosanthes scabra]
RRQGRIRRRSPGLHHHDPCQAEEVDFSQSAPTPAPTRGEPAPALAPGSSSSPPANLSPAKFRMKQPIIRPPSTTIANPKELIIGLPTAASTNLKEPQAFTFMPTPGFKPPRNM